MVVRRRQRTLQPLSISVLNLSPILSIRPKMAPNAQLGYNVQHAAILSIQIIFPNDLLLKLHLSLYRTRHVNYLHQSSYVGTWL